MTKSTTALQKALLKKLAEPNKSLLGKGFTLIELLIVVVILGILAAFIIPNLADSTDRARVNTANAAAKSAAQGCAAAIVSGDAGTYVAPTNITESAGGCVDGATYTTGAAFGVDTDAVYTVTGTTVDQTTSAAMN